ncbi:hypothetical protein SEA_PUPPER_89 [Gordonia phage Pupper]|uniref:Uncharacterized protein n=1 Tax=Gordonia phage Pupper TaxID=2571249 RepID=A0A4Y6EKK9_9CAUD|nr:hypothetical protein KHQ83_gp188 [Gordonia phage Pupper]QDF18575.1 hypothetical protein SEA_PUPPER_89 [Gordonia phage Pupper]
MEGIPAGVRAYRNEEHGLRLPDGTTVWQPDTWNGMPLATESDRQAIEQVLIAKLIEVGGSTEFLGQYLWLKRFSTFTVVSETPHSADAIQLRPQSADNEAETATEVREELVGTAGELAGDLSDIVNTVAQRREY